MVAFLLNSIMRLKELTEVRSDDQEWDDNEEYDELLISQRITNYFIKRGYGYLGEGREQIALLSPRGTVVKILGQGDPERQNIVKAYVKFFEHNQRNPHYPRIYSTNDFTVEGETYFIYEMEYLNSVSGEEEVLEYIEDLMGSLPYGEKAIYAFQKNRKMPKELTPEQVDGLIAATQDLEDFLGGRAPLDLRAIENLGSRDSGQLVIIDPYSL